MKNNIDFPVKLAAPAYRALVNAGINSLLQLSAHSEKEIAGLHGIGKNALGTLKTALKENGLSFRKNLKQTSFSKPPKSTI